MTDCRQVYYHLCDNLDADLNSPRCRQIRKHLEHCPECQANLATLKKTVALYRTARIPGVRREAHRRLYRTLRLEFQTGGADSTTPPHTLKRKKQ